MQTTALERRLPGRHIVYIDKRSRKRIIWHGERFLHEALPEGTRVIYPPDPIAGLPDPDRAIREALNHPEGTDPLHARLRPGMKVTIALDDVSLPLPIMARPDNRERVLNVVLQMLADYGVDDIHLIVATAFHRRMTPAEMARMAGSRAFKAFYPYRYYNHDAEDAANMVLLGHTEQGEPVTLNRRVAESDLLIYININLVPMDGGHKSVGTGLCDYRTLKAHHNPATIRACGSYMDPDRSELHRSVDRVGRVIDRELDVFHIETVLNNRMYGPATAFLGKNEDTLSDAERLAFLALHGALRRAPRALARRGLMRVPSPYEMIGVYAGKTEPTHERTLARSYEQYAVPVEGQADVMIVGVPFVGPYNVNSIMNPLLVQVMGLGYLYNQHRGKPLLKQGGTLIICHPCYDEFDPEIHPSYIEFFHRLLPETRDAMELHRRYEAEFAADPGYVAMYRTGHAFHPVHPFYMWYWGENGRQHCGRVIAAGVEQPYVAERLGWEWASTLAEALEMAKDTCRDPQITLFHMPPIFIPDVG